VKYVTLRKSKAYPMALITGLLAGVGATAATAGAGAATAATAAGAAGVAGGGISAAGALGAITGLVGTGVQMMGQRAAAKASEKAEELRERQMSLEARRQRRTVIREAQVARATALASGVEQGAQNSSGLQGGFAQISGQKNTNLQASYQSEEIGHGIFSANRAIAQGQSMAALGGAISGFGQQMVQNMPTLTRVGQYYGFGANK
jgi:hypothetical protein